MSNRKQCVGILFGWGERGGGGGRGIGVSRRSSPRKNDMFERRKQGDEISADAALAASALTAATANNGRHNVFS